MSDARPAFLTVDQAARVLGCSSQRVYALCADGRLAHYQFGDRGHIRIRPEDIDAFLASCRREARPASPRRAELPLSSGAMYGGAYPGRAETAGRRRRA